MTERRKQASILLGIAIPLLAFGIAKFEFHGGNSSAMAMIIAIHTLMKESCEQWYTSEFDKKRK